tara:strand:- start:763 stop:3369 length:2607 start_codon:yes stop_codon:yes gene_type:complete
MRIFPITFLILCSWSLAFGDDTKSDAEETWQRWIERDFPFFSSVVSAKTEISPDNMTPRGIVFHFGDTFVCWDVDNLRISAIWEADGAPFQNYGMAPFSYPDQFRKIPGGQNSAPAANGDIWMSNRIYPGVATGELEPRDQRPPHPRRVQEVGRGAIPLEVGQFVGMSYENGGTLHYEIGSVPIRERITVDQSGVSRVLTIAPHEQELSFVLGKKDPEIVLGPDAIKNGARIYDKPHWHEDNVRILGVAPATKEREIRVTFARNLENAQNSKPRSGPFWPEKVKVEIPPFQPGESATELEEIPLPHDNPWNRAVRAAGMDFFPDGTIVVVTFDGDIWIGDKLSPGAKAITWKRFASGLHEPLSVVIHDEKIHVFDRNGIWRILDTDGDGEADFHEMVSNQFDQTAESREFASDMKIMPDGTFLICKPGQQSSSIGKSSGTILRIPPDGKSFAYVASGLRQPFLGFDPKSGQIAVSDQQGHFVPSTPVHFVSEGDFFGFLPSNDDEYPGPISPPLTWIPHHVCASAASIHWLHGDRFGPLDDACVLVSFNAPGLLQIFEDRESPVKQGAAARLPIEADFGPLKGATNPADGMFYIAGFKVWGTTGNEVTSLSRLRIHPEKEWPLPVEVKLSRRGAYLRFSFELDPEFATTPSRYEVNRWNYLRSPAYGSAAYRLDGSKGQDRLAVSSVKLSADGKSVFIGVPNMLEAMQIEVDYDVQSTSGGKHKKEVFFTAHQLVELDLTELGFADNEVDLSHSEIVKENIMKPDAEIGKQLYTNFGCIACHSLDGSLEGKTGPSWKGLFGSERTLIGNGQTVVANEAYLKESIKSPAAKIAQGAVNGEAGMPIYEGVLSDAQIESLILFMKSLADEG